MSEVEPKAVEGGVAAPPPAEPDRTLDALVSLTQRIHQDFMASGELNVPRSLATLRKEAGGAGFGGDSDGIYRFLQAQASAAAEHERNRREAGLGGAMRRTLDTMTALRDKASVVEVAQAKPFRDPALDAGENSLLTAKVHAAIARIEALSRGGKPPA